jgi:putative tRNA adenosine deaminase-associated protein
VLPCSLRQRILVPWRLRASPSLWFARTVAGSAHHWTLRPCEIFVVVRPVPGGVSLLLSDAGAALDYDIAADVLDLLRVEVPEEDAVDDDVWPEGDLGLLADLGLPAAEMQVIIDEVDLYPDEQLDMIAQRCGFQPQLSALLEKQPG